MGILDNFKNAQETKLAPNGITLGQAARGEY